MPLLDVDAQIRALGGDKPLPRGQITVKYLQAPGRPAVTLAGAELTFSPTIGVQIVNGILDAALDVPATDEHCYAEVTIETFTGGGKYISGPVSIPVGAATLADLPPVDPATFEPLPAVPPTAQELIERAVTAIETAEGALSGSADSAESAAASATFASASATAADASAAVASWRAEDSAASATAADAARAEALSARDTAVAAREDSTLSAATSVSAATDASASASEAASSRTTASEKATAASQSAQEAAASAAASVHLKLDTEQYRAEASEFSASALQSKLDAAASADAAATARTGAETARAGAEAAQAAAQATTWGGVNLASDVNLDNLLNAGRYYFASSAPSLANNYPFASGSGLIEVLKYSGTAQAVVQRITYTSGTFGVQGSFTRRWLNSWGAWQFTPSLRLNSPTDQPGTALSVNAVVNGSAVELFLPLTQIFLGTADLNSVTVTGTYVQTSSSNASLARNYPVASYGMLDVVAMSTSVQQKYTQSGNSGMRGTWIRNRNTNGTDWSPWVLMPAIRINNPTDQPGAEYFMWNGSAEQQVQPIAIGFSGTSQSLDAITAGGSYYNTTTTIATLANGWPVAGIIATLEVIPGSSGGNCIQRLTPFGGNQLVRGQYVRRRASGVWDPWRFMPTVYVDQAAGRTLSIWDDLNNRPQVIYGDTGWRRIDSLLVNGWVMNTNGALLIRRVGSQVTLMGYALNGDAATADSFVTNASLPGFFRYLGTHYLPICRTPTEFASLILGQTGIGLTVGKTYGTTSYWSATWQTSDTWPTSLPGVAQGSVPV